MDLRRSGRIIGSKKSASTPGPLEQISGTAAIAANRKAVVTWGPQPPPVAPSAPAIPVPAPQTIPMQHVQSSTPLAYQGLDMQQMWFPSMEDARRHTITAWQPHCSEQDVPMSDDEKAPFVLLLRNCMLDFSDVHGNANTSNAVQEGRFPKHYYEAAAVRVVDAAVILHLLGKQNRGEADPTVSRSGVVNNARRNMGFRQRLNTIGLLFKTEKKTVWDVIKGEKDLEYLCVMAPEVRTANLEKDRTNNGKRPRVPKKAGGKRHRDEADEVRNDGNEACEELGPVQQRHPFSGARETMGRPSSASALILHNAFAAPSSSSQDASSVQYGSSIPSPNFPVGGSIEGSTPYTMPVWTPQDSVGASPRASDLPVLLAPSFGTHENTTTMCNSSACQHQYTMATPSISTSTWQYVTGDQESSFNEQDNGNFNATNNPGGIQSNGPSSFAYANSRQPPFTPNSSYNMQRPAKNTTSGNLQQEEGVFGQDAALSSGYFPPRVHYQGSFSPSYGLQFTVLGHDPNPFQVNEVMGVHQPVRATHNRSVGSIIDPRLMPEYGHGHMSMSPASTSHEQALRQVQHTQHPSDRDDDEELQAFAA